MKILFINKYDITGGAAVAAFRLHKALEEYHLTDNYFLVGIKKSLLSNVTPTRKKGFQNLAERGINFLFNLIGLQYFYFPFSTGTILRKVKELHPDVINLHNAHGGYFRISLLKEISGIAPVVWTLHDMWAFTANAAHTFGNESWKYMRAGKDEKKYFIRTGINTGNFLIRRKKEIYNKSNLTIVAPSKWLYSLAKQSPVLKGKEIHLIPNGVNLEIFHPIKKNLGRKKLNIPGEAKVLSFSAEKISTSPYKGGEDLVNILKELDSKINFKLHLIVIGKGKFSLADELNNFIIHQTGYIYDENLLAEYLSASDIFVYPTRADNLPTALIEASACGIPSVTFDIGGCKEIIEDNYNGYIIPPFNIKMFAEKLIYLLDNENLRQTFSINGRLKTEKEFSIQKMGDSYFNLFNKLTKNFDKH